MSLANKSIGISIAAAAVAVLLAGPASAQTAGSKMQVTSNAASPMMAQAGPSPTVRPTTSTQSAGGAGGTSPMAKASNQLK